MCELLELVFGLWLYVAHWPRYALRSLEDCRMAGFHQAKRHTLQITLDMLTSLRSGANGVRYVMYRDRETIPVELGEERPFDERGQAD
jgi:hypothetical protein